MERQVNSIFSSDPANGAFNINPLGSTFSVQLYDAMDSKCAKQWHFLGRGRCRVVQTGWTEGPYSTGTLAGTLMTAQPTSMYKLATPVVCQKAQVCLSPLFIKDKCKLTLRTATWCPSPA